VSAETQEAEYSSGLYFVRDVSCANCKCRLGIVYVGAADVENQYKVGKFLMSQEQLLVPWLGSDSPDDEEALRVHLLELLEKGGALRSARRRQRRMEELARAREEEENAEATEVLPQPVAVQRQATPTPRRVQSEVGRPQPRWYVRYVRCIMPAQYVPVVWTGGTPSQATSTLHYHPPRVVQPVRLRLGPYEQRGPQRVWLSSAVPNSV